MVVSDLVPLVERTMLAALQLNTVIALLSAVQCRPTTRMIALWFGNCSHGVLR